ncbi:MAG: heat-inducible transcription repressor HrcA [Candidatus Omnitrophica bacterium]|nr:heat-inducible transcription repressor HrcA [Candidatus Omnitrophota bacterium]
MSVTDFEQRRNSILEAVIEVYVTTASPVGSELISRKLRESLSPATIRNIMVELEEAGFLEQPHTSAGRVPTDRGYRYYINSLMEAMRLSTDESGRLGEAVQLLQQLEADAYFHRVSDMLSEMSGQAAFVMAPTIKRTTVKQIELVPVSARKLLCVLVGQETLVVSHVVETEEPLSREEVAALAHFLNAELVGLPTQEWLVSLERRLLAVNDSLYYLVKRSLHLLQIVLATEPEERLFIEGIFNLFTAPEARREPQKVQQLLYYLDSPELLRELIREDLAREGTHVRIGQELGVEGVDEWSYVLSPFRHHHAIVGGVGVLGPKRMDYRRARALTEHVAQLVSTTMARWEAGA